MNINILQPLRFVRCVVNHNDLKLYKYNIGDVVYITDTNCYYIYDGNTFSEISPIKDLTSEIPKERYKKIYINHPIKCKFCGANLYSYKCIYCDTEYPNYKIIDIEEGKEVWNT